MLEKASSILEGQFQPFIKGSLVQAQPGHKLWKTLRIQIQLSAKCMAEGKLQIPSSGGGAMMLPWHMPLLAVQ